MSAPSPTAPQTAGRDIRPAAGMDAIAACDPEVAALIHLEARRQDEGLELIASENYASEAVLAATGSVLTNKYAEGPYGRRYYGGCQVVDQIEALGAERACALFGAEYANLQPHSGTQANMAVFHVFSRARRHHLGDEP